MRNEADTRAELIDPVLHATGWGVVEESRIRREVIAPGRLIGGGKRAKPKYADYVLIYRHQKLAVIEAKAESLPYTEGVQQAKEDSDRLQVRYSYATNGRKIYQVDRLTGKEQDIEHYPTPDELWNMTFPSTSSGTTNVWRDRFAVIPFEDKSGTWEARYYQHNAITKVLEAIAKKGKVPKNGNVFFTIFQTFMTETNTSTPFDNAQGKPLGVIGDEEPTPRLRPVQAPNFGEYPPDFFDLIIIDECHRGGARNESTWRGILDYFSPAVQLGLTATPHRDVNADTYNYFGEPLYEYSLAQGIEDGYLTPFKVHQIQTNLDQYVYSEEDFIIAGNIEEDRIYTEQDFNRIIEMRPHEAHRVKVFMEAINQNEKTLVFCATQDHALMVRDLINQMKISNDPN